MRLCRWNVFRWQGCWHSISLTSRITILFIFQTILQKKNFKLSPALAPSITNFHSISKEALDGLKCHLKIVTYINYHLNKTIYNEMYNWREDEWMNMLSDNLMNLSKSALKFCRLTFFVWHSMFSWHSFWKKK